MTVKQAGRKGGQAKSEAKSAAARANGAKAKRQMTMEELGMKMPSSGKIAEIPEREKEKKQ